MRINFVKVPLAVSACACYLCYTRSLGIYFCVLVVEEQEKDTGLI